MSAERTPIPLSRGARERLNMLFAPRDRAEAERLLIERWGPDPPSVSQWTPFGIDRLRYAALKLSDGSLDRLRNALNLANGDFRDLLMAAGFGRSVTAHLLWMPDELSR